MRAAIRVATAHNRSTARAHRDRPIQGLFDHCLKTGASERALLLKMRADLGECSLVETRAQPLLVCATPRSHVRRERQVGFV
jgi:hypothetical protein